ncbi:hypothetical protein [Yinghuangia soli]|uniref:Uncharacterized protein n=1 Tax=Yinghuangia soli TaxID=2908204 RepID=A0AA41PWW4_9ACTN|nr:hypothetical protein [Yinghuangia soli]MCF2526032.1 hypothetical protein [Yinghuangia soli]
MLAIALAVGLAACTSDSGDKQPSRTGPVPTNPQSTGGGTAGPSGGSGVAPTGPPLPGTYDVSVTGTAPSFQLSGTLYLRSGVVDDDTTSAVNMVEICLVTGYPYERPEMPSIWFGSNAVCQPDAGEKDLGFVAVEGTQVLFEPDPVEAVGRANVFTAGTSPTCVYKATSGRLTVTAGTTEGTVTGTVEVSGPANGACPPERVQATFTGTRR